MNQLKAATSVTSIPTLLERCGGDFQTQSEFENSFVLIKPFESRSMENAHPSATTFTVSFDGVEVKYMRTELKEGDNGVAWQINFNDLFE